MSDAKKENFQAVSHFAFVELSELQLSFIVTF